jgi:signal transduction histidine kinase
MNKFRLRSRFLVVRLLIAAGLTAAVILIVRYSFGRRARQQISAQLEGCRDRFQAFQAQNEAMLARTSAILARSAELRKLTAEQPRAAGKDALSAIAREAGADFLMLADEKGAVWATDLPERSRERGNAEALLKAWSDGAQVSSYWLLAERIYQVHRQEIAVGEVLEGRREELIVGTEMGQRLAAETGAICGCDVAFAYDGGIAASTLGSASERELAAKISGAANRRIVGATSIDLSNEPYRALIVPVTSTSAAPEFVALRSFAAASAQQSEFMRLMVMLAAGAMVIGFFLVLRVSDTFARPLGNLVEAVRALEKGDFGYPVKVDSRDELEEVTQAFDQMRSSLRETQQHLIRSERLATIGQMASSISHDLRHPLTAIMANSEFLCEDKLTLEQRQGLHQEIRMAVDQMNDLVESLLEFSRGREAPRIVAVNLGEMIEHVVRTVGSRSEFQAVKLRVYCPRGFECLLDPLKVERAVGNLVINACEAVTADAGRVEVIAVESNGTAEIRVVDNGPGVAEAIRATIFQPFVSHGKTKGTGLGLAAVQKICRDHGGEATLESSRPGHTVFKLTLPRRR